MKNIDEIANEIEKRSKKMLKIQNMRTNIRQELKELYESCDTCTASELNRKMYFVEEDIWHLTMEERSLEQLKKRKNPFKTYRITLGEIGLYYTYDYISDMDKKDVQKTIFNEIEKVWKILGENNHLKIIMDSDELKENLKDKNIYYIDEYVDLNKKSFYAYDNFERCIQEMHKEEKSENTDNEE